MCQEAQPNYSRYTDGRANRWVTYSAQEFIDTVQGDLSWMQNLVNPRPYASNLTHLE
jgi:hypothetical protein